MKTRLFLTSLFAFLIFNIGNAQPSWEFHRSLISADQTDTIEIFLFLNNPLRVPNSLLMRIESNSDSIKEIEVEKGTSEKLSDGSFLIKFSEVQNGRHYTLIGNKKYKYYDITKSLSKPNYFCLKNFASLINRDLLPEYQLHRYTIDDIIRNGKILVFNKDNIDSIFRITEFRLSFRDNDNKINFLSPVFKNDSIPSNFSRSLRTFFAGPSKTGAFYFTINYVKIIGPDSVIYKMSNNFQSAIIFKDSSDLLIHQYLVRNFVVRSDIRIKVDGNPNPEDLRTVKKIVNDINLLNANIKAKIVHFFPSIEVHFDTLDTSFGKGALTGTKQSTNTNLFFHNLSYTKIFINTRFKEQLDRDLFLWQKITRSLANFQNTQQEYKNSIIIGQTKIPGLTYDDKLVLKAILSKDSPKTLKLFGRSLPTNYSHILLTVFVSMILFFIFYEINSYFNLGRLFKNAFLLNSIYSILIAQLFILTSFFIQNDFLREWYQREIYFCSFALAAGLLFFVSDRILKKEVKVTWLRLTLSPVFTLISLYIAYQIIYLFVRAEFLRFITIDINAIIIGLSIMVVRFYLLYENEKVTSLLQEKEYELTRQRELKNRAELSTLQAKINPHFLYNALNSIAALAHIDSKRTEDMALSLSKLFRYNLNREEDMNSTIRQEIEMVQLYLQIEKQRFPDRLTFEVSITENLYERPVPRFLIQPLVENAIKHGVSQITGQGIIKLKIYEEGKSLFIEIHDNGPQFPQGLVTGYGLQNTYDKLTLVYKKPYEVRFVNEPKKYIQIKL